MSWTYYYLCFSWDLSPLHLYLLLPSPVLHCRPLTQPEKPRAKSPCQLAFGNWKAQTCQNVGKCKTGLERRTPSLHVRHLGPKSSWHWAGSMWTPPESDSLRRWYSFVILLNLFSGLAECSSMGKGACVAQRARHRLSWKEDKSSVWRVARKTMGFLS